MKYNYSLNYPYKTTTVIDGTVAGTRLDIFLTNWLEDYSRASVQRFIKEGQVLVNGSRARQSYILRSGDHLQVEIVPPQESSIMAQPISLDVVYEDEDLLVINKPKGMVVHPAPGHTKDTLVNALMHYCSDLSGIGGKLRPGIVHRLDKDTSGLLVVAKNDTTHHELSRQLKSKEMKREYVVLVWGYPKSKYFKVSAPIARHPHHRKKMAVVSWGKDAVTRFRLLVSLPKVSLLRAQLETGRTHQVRVHLSHNGLPVVGDALYGGFSKELEDIAWFGQALHARKLSFSHPRTDKSVLLVSALPGEFRKLIHAYRDKF